MNQSRPQGRAASWLLTAAAIIAVLLSQAAPARAQAPANPCPKELMHGQKLIPVPVIGTTDGKMRGTIRLSDEQAWIPMRLPISSTNLAPSDQSKAECAPQYIRVFRELGTAPTMASVPTGPFSKGAYALPRPGPTLRARVGDLVQLTFINQVNPANFGDTIDRGETGRNGGCDESSAYPRNTGDRYPDCFHGSSTGNIHFHGTHTNMNSTGDNVFIEVRPSLRVNGKPIVTPESVEKPFSEFFKQCEAELSLNPLRQWPKTWDDLPSAWTDEQKWLLKLYDAQLEQNYGSVAKKLWPVDERQLQQGAWPQYYVGAFPYCFRLPQYTATVFPPPVNHAAHQGAGTAEDPESTRVLMMGQAPGTHWYHAHKHGSTAINVANGMTGAFIIEGQYDDDLNAFYGDGWTRTQPVMVINQLGTSPNLMRKANPNGPNPGQQDKGPDLSVNGQYWPVIHMRPGEVQMWRFVNTSGRAGTYFLGPPANFQWKQLAQDGVQFNDTNYSDSINLNRQFLLAAGNRADLLIKAPTTGCAKPGDCPVMIKNEVDPQDLSSAQPLTLLSVVLTGSAADPKSNGAQFIPHAPTFPLFLADIPASEVKGTKTITFASTPPMQSAHTIDGRKFNGEVGAVVLLNQTEEWKVLNATYGPPISHPFHIHINPFQVVEVFDPNQGLIDPKTGKPPIDPSTGKPYIDPQTNKQAVKYAFHPNNLAPGQCYLDPNNPESWKPCGPPLPQTNMIWWDTFPIPSGYAPTTDAAGNNPLMNSQGQPVQVPGYFKMRSRFVDYIGYYVLHCHILAHEDRGMMTVVEVAPARSLYSHH
ncbi:MAG: multicopper oxidase domain-containing protein [Blastocatellia bacterium]